MIRLIAGVLFGAMLCIQGAAQQRPLTQGIWRGIFVAGQREIPVNFEISRQDGKTIFTTLNAGRRDDFDVVFVGGDSLHIIPQTFEYRLSAKIETDGTLTGEYINLVPGTEVSPLPFRAQAGAGYRFVRPGDERAPATDLTGRWALRIAGREGNAANRVAVFTQKGARLHGIILSVTGDSRELEGDVQGDHFSLSGFTGSDVMLVEGKLSGPEGLEGTIGFGDSALRFSAVRDENAALADAYALTYLKPGYNKLEVQLPDLEGNTVSLSDPRFKGKVVIIELLGSWCSNCIDQIGFLAPWYRANRHRGVEVIGVAFEAKDDMEFAGKTLSRLKARLDIPYDILFGGKADKDIVQSEFEALNAFLAFPTTIIIGRDGTVRKIHTGFSGKGTGVFYQDFVDKWNKDLDLLIAEPQP